MLAIVYGTRPEWLKVKPIVKELQRRYLPFLLVRVNQHTTLLPDEAWFDVDVDVEEEHGRLNEVIRACLTWQIPESVTHVMVQGDTATTFGMALNAFQNKREVIHLEAGLRSGNRTDPFPEEGYRRMVTQIASVNLAPTVYSASRLRDERAPMVYQVGNTSLDNLKEFKTDVVSNVVLVTLHRREKRADMEHWLSRINWHARQSPRLNFIYIKHPACGNMDFDRWENISAISPLEHEDFLELLSSCRYVITDSGGVVEESSFFGKKSIVCREYTERSEAVHSGHSLIVKQPNSLIFQHNDIQSFLKAPLSACPFGDGNSAEIVVSILQEEIDIWRG